MRHYILGAIAPVALIATTPAHARETRVDVPVQLDPKNSVYVLWVKVKTDEGRTTVSGYVRQKRWFARSKGDLHVEYLTHGQVVACQETDWKKYRLHSRGQWRFSTSANVSATSIDTVRISHVNHDRETDRSRHPLTTCSVTAEPSAVNSRGA